MFCKNCGHERQEGEKFCPVCGTPFPIDHDEGEPIDPSQKKKKDLGLTPVVLTHAVQNSAKRKRTVKAKAASAPAKHVQVSQVQEELPNDIPSQGLILLAWIMMLLFVVVLGYKILLSGGANSTWTWIILGLGIPVIVDMYKKLPKRMATSSGLKVCSCVLAGLCFLSIACTGSKGASSLNDVKSEIVGKTWTCTDVNPNTSDMFEASFMKFVFKDDGSVLIYSANPSDGSWGEPLSGNTTYEITTERWSDTGEEYFKVRILLDGSYRGQIAFAKRGTKIYDLNPKKFDKGYGSLYWMSSDTPREIRPGDNAPW